MGIIQDLTRYSLREKGISGFSAAMPAISTRWCNAAGANVTTAIEADATSHRIRTLGANQWLAPLPARVQVVNVDHPIDVSLFLPTGTAVTGPGLLCTLFPQAYLRLARLAARHFENENAHNPKRAQGIPLHPVPCYYFVRPAAMPAGVRGGMVRAGEGLDMGGDLDFFDASGHWIHPLMVASMLSRLVTQYPALNVSASAVSQFASVVGLVADGRRVRLVRPDGSNYDQNRFEGITLVDAATQLYTVNAYTGTDTTIVGEIRRVADTGNAGDFPTIVANRTLVQHAAYGRMGSTVTLPQMPTATALQHDFYTLIVTDLNRSLLGERPDAFNGVRLEPAPVVRIHEHLRLLAHGNAVMSGLASIQSGTTADSLLVAPSQRYRFPLPPADFSPATWPSFPAIGAVVADAAAFPTGLAQEIQENSIAKFVTPASGAPSDVELRLKGLPKGSAVRVYHRVFLPDAVLKRGDGAGGVVTNEDTTLATTYKGTLNLVLINPLGIIRPDGTGNTVPTDPKVIVDMVIVLRDGKKRMLGVLEWNVQAMEAPVSAAIPENGLQNFQKRGVCNAGILGNTAPPLANAWPINSWEQFLDVVMQLSGEPTAMQPLRDAPRLPSMARREMLAASRTGTDWKALLSGGPLSPAMHHAHAVIGSPGGLGGREQSMTGVYAEHNRLAYDLARAAFRRTRYFATRLQDLWDTNWNEPAEATPLGETDSPTGGRGTMHGAVLQTVAPVAESPELALLKSLVDANIASIPATWDALVDQVVAWINTITAPLGTNLQTQVANQLNSLKDNQPGNESRQERLYNELKREVSAACYGRRDTLWAMREGIRQAKHFIYLETPGFSFTKRAAETEPYSVDLIAALTTRLNQVPGLKVILCMPKRPDYFTPGYDQWIAREVEQRFTQVLGLPSRQVVSFHPIGFPGRPSNIETTTMIVDDRWALIGASAFRRRGLTFDGSSDLVLIDGEQALGAAPTLTDLRVQLLKQHLGLEGADANPSSLTQLQDARTAFQLVRETLIAGGMGRIERLWNGREDYLPYSAPTVDIDLSNPEGITFNALAAVVVSLFTNPLTGQ